MANVNIVLLAGNLTAAPEMRYTPSGTAVARLRLAVNRKYRDQKSNELREEATFIDVEVFGKQAETAGQYLTKGRGVLVEGRLKLDQWDDKQTGQKRSRLKVVAMRLQFLGPPPQGGARPAGAAPAAAPASATPKPGTTPEAAEEPGTEPEPDLDIQEEQIPF